jgi:hypothetical protein
MLGTMRASLDMDREHLAFVRALLGGPLDD